VEFYPFDDAYLRRLQEDDPATQAHFVAYFSKLLRIKVGKRRLPADEGRDVEQETFLRVLLAVRKGEIQHAERLGAYVNSTCSNILQEIFRENERNQYVDVDTVDVPDSGAGLESKMISDETQKAVHKAMGKLSGRDKKILTAVLDGSDKDVTCRELEVDRDYLRVLTHRAIGNFKQEYQGKKGPRGSGHAAGTSL
jgi:DNA-directed RNA polymerase specialized sigma24 family protein